MSLLSLAAICSASQLRLLWILSHFQAIVISHINRRYFHLLVSKIKIHYTYVKKYCACVSVVLSAAVRKNVLEPVDVKSSHPHLMYFFSSLIRHQHVNYIKMLAITSLKWIFFIFFHVCEMCKMRMWLDQFNFWLYAMI